jgi:predicted nucleotidyltransferase
VLLPEVDRVVRVYLTLVDEALPGCLEGFYVVGSVAVGDFRSSSDVDFVAVSAEPGSPTTMDAFEQAHAVVRAEMPFPPLEGLYVRWDDLRHSSALIESHPFHHDGVFHRTGTFNANPITWLELAHHGIPVRGPGPRGIGVWEDPVELRRWCLRNLDTYWSAWVDRMRDRAARGGASLSDREVAWGVLGVSRLHYTMARGAIVSKEEAGEYALRTFGARWFPILREGLAIHRGTAPRRHPSAVQRHEEVLSFIGHVIADAGRGRG